MAKRGDGYYHKSVNFNTEKKRDDFHDKNVNNKESGVIRIEKHTNVDNDGKRIYTAHIVSDHAKRCEWREKQSDAAYDKHLSNIQSDSSYNGNSDYYDDDKD